MSISQTSNNQGFANRQTCSNGLETVLLDGPRRLPVRFDDQSARESTDEGQDGPQNERDDCHQTIDKYKTNNSSGNRSSNCSDVKGSTYESNAGEHYNYYPLYPVRCAHGSYYQLRRVLIQIATANRGFSPSAIRLGEITSVEVASEIFFPGLTDGIDTASDFVLFDEPNLSELQQPHIDVLLFKKHPVIFANPFWRMGSLSLQKLKNSIIRFYHPVRRETKSHVSRVKPELDNSNHRHSKKDYSSTENAEKPKVEELEVELSNSNVQGWTGTTFGIRGIRRIRGAGRRFICQKRGPMLQPSARSGSAEVASETMCNSDHTRQKSIVSTNGEMTERNCSTCGGLLLGEVILGPAERRAIPCGHAGGAR